MRDKNVAASRPPSRHTQEWADGGPTVAENLILLCRFHHGRIHTTGWTVEKTGPGQAIITHHAQEGHEGDEANGNQESAPGQDPAGCGCSDWRTDADMDAESQARTGMCSPLGCIARNGPRR